MVPMQPRNWPPEFLSVTNVPARRASTPVGFRGEGMVSPSPMNFSTLNLARPSGEMSSGGDIVRELRSDITNKTVWQPAPGALHRDQARSPE